MSVPFVYAVPAAATNEMKTTTATPTPARPAVVAPLPRTMRQHRGTHRTRIATAPSTTHAKQEQQKQKVSTATPKTAVFGASFDDAMPLTPRLKTTTLPYQSSASSAEIASMLRSVGCRWHLPSRARCMHAGALRSLMLARALASISRAPTLPPPPPAPPPLPPPPPPPAVASSPGCGPSCNSIAVRGKAARRRNCDSAVRRNGWKTRRPPMPLSAASSTPSSVGHLTLTSKEPCATLRSPVGIRK
mmetsp:Transcript_3849/g.14314  ORF Transcript_3849/g.14314 Transcript_3849/m.14314 type:complete len:246 (+) Transcript_3849:706-1443(+)